MVGVRSGMAMGAHCGTRAMRIYLMQHACQACHLPMCWPACIILSLNSSWFRAEVIRPESHLVLEQPLLPQPAPQFVRVRAPGR